MAAYDAGIVTAYGAAVQGGYTGTYEQFCNQQAHFADYAAQAQEAAQTAETVANLSIANEYSSSSTYVVGDMCMHEGQLYECSTAISTAEEWTAAHWTAKTVADEVSSLMGGLNGKLDAPSTAGTSGQVLTSDGEGGQYWHTQSGGGGGTSDYDDLTDKPSINSVTLSGNKTTSDLGIHDIPSGGSSGQVLAKASATNYDLTWVNQSGGGGTSDYSDLTNKPSINSVTLSGNKSLADIGAASASDLSDLEDEFDELKENHRFQQNVNLSLAFVQGNISDSKGTDSGSTHVIRTNAYYDVSTTSSVHVVYNNLNYSTLLFCLFTYDASGNFLSVDYKHAGTYDINVSSAATIRFKVQREDSSTIVDPNDGTDLVSASYVSQIYMATEHYVDTSVASGVATAKAYTDSKINVSERIKLYWQTGKVSDSTGQDSGSSNTSYIRNSFTVAPPRSTISYNIPEGIVVNMYVYSGADYSTYVSHTDGLVGSGTTSITLGQWVRFVAYYTNESAIATSVGDTIILSCPSDLSDIASDLTTNRIASYVSFSMFTDFAVCGDSFASGGMYPSGTGISVYELSWAQVLARKSGITAYNYSAGGLSTKDWLSNSSYGLAKLLSDSARKMYICNFGINDNTQINNGTFTLGTVADIKSDYTQNPESFYGCYGRIIGNIKTHAPNAPIILLSVARPNARNMDASIEEIAEACGIPYISLTDDPYFNSGYFIGSFVSNHPLAYSYSGMANAIDRLVCHYIAENPTYFMTYT